MCIKTNYYWENWKTFVLFIIDDTFDDLETFETKWYNIYIILIQIEYKCQLHEEKIHNTYVSI